VFLKAEHWLVVQQAVHCRFSQMSGTVEATFEEGDAEQLPYPDGHFDVVASMFGAMFAPRPEQVASELARACRPGGKIALANWTPEGITGHISRLSDRYLPASAGIPSPVLWAMKVSFGAG
jgi:ubiquinone/menaquinone biosynthesis C-methylase UbiE